MSERLVLASASPRRAAILRSLDVPFRVVVSSVDEKPAPGETAAEMVARLAREKALDVARHEMLPVLAADTVVVIDGAILGKPSSREDAAGMLRRLAGREHEVLTGLCLVSGGVPHVDVERTVVRFAPMDESEVAFCTATDEPLDKAGAYHVEGRAALFIAAIVGSPSNVAGLPVRLLYTLAARAGVPLAGMLS